MTVLYCKTRTGGWATHRPTATKTTKTGIPLYTLLEAQALGYSSPEKPAKPTITQNQNLVVHIWDNPRKGADGYLEIGQVVYQDGTSKVLGYNPLKPDTKLHTYRQLGHRRYTARKIVPEGVKGRYVTYENGVAVLQGGSPFPLFSSADLKAAAEQNRGEWADRNLGAIQMALEDLSDGTVEVQLPSGKIRAFPKAPQEWMQLWFNRGILWCKGDHTYISEKKQELYSFYLTWTLNRFLGDENAYKVLQEWAKQDHHLALLSEAHRFHQMSRRNDRYRKQAFRLAQEAKGGSIQVQMPPKVVKGKKAPKAEVGTEEAASRSRMIQNLAASKTFVAYLESCCKRDGVLFEPIERAQK